METGRDTEEKRVGESSGLMDEDGVRDYRVIFFSHVHIATRSLSSRVAAGNAVGYVVDTLFAENPGRDFSPLFLHVRQRRKEKKKEELQDVCQV